MHKLRISTRRAFIEKAIRVEGVHYGRVYIFAHPMFWNARSIRPDIHIDGNMAACKHPERDSALDIWLDIVAPRMRYRSVSDIADEVQAKIKAAGVRKDREAAGEIALF